MKTLDEVIDNFEKACDLERRCEGCSGCLGQENGCPNDGAECVPDALYYLKELRHILDDAVWVGSTKEENGYWKLPTLPETGNDPLTWDELEKMEGKPIWVEWLADDIWSDPNHRERSTWWVVGEVRKNDIIIAQYLDEAELCEDDLGAIWLAYLKEKNE